MYKEFLQFPKDFAFGVSTSSYQIEGAAFEDNKGLSIWDKFTHDPKNIEDKTTGDIACDHYHKWENDLDLMKSLGIKNYRFSIAWARIFPNGKIDSLNQKGIDFYKTLVIEMLKRDITPYVTLFHWDLPLELQKEGGFANKKIIDYFFDYAKVLLKELSPYVKNWMTFNEPWVYAFNGNLIGLIAPGIKDLKIALEVSHNMLLAHAKTVEYCHKHYKNLRIGLVNNLEQIESSTKREEDILAAKRWDEAYNAWYMDPLFKASYPKDLEKYYRNHPTQDGKVENVMCDYTQDEMDYICENKGDFLGINYYTRHVIAFDKNDNHINAKCVFKPMIKRAGIDSWEVNPEAFYNVLMGVREKYGDIEIYITENGTCGNDSIGEDGCVHDSYRVEYIRRHFAAAHQAIKDGVNIKGYFVWSFLDNFEWAYGYTKRFGIVYCDYENNQNRIIKDSGHFVSHVFNKNGFNIT